MPAPRGLTQQLDQRLHRSLLLPRGGRLLVAVSGGADSVALLRLLAAINQSAFWEWKLTVAHVDHGMRGRHSTADAAFVKRLARSLQLPCRVKRLRLGSKGSEDEARQARLRALSQMARSARSTAIVMAHHADDQAETVLMRLFRGCGMEGLAGIASRAVLQGRVVVRPLLHLRRQELRDYLEGLKQPWREDGSNAMPRYLRNRIRAELMPVIEGLWPQAVATVCRVAQLAAEAQEAIGSAAEAPLAAARRKPGGIVIPRKVMRDIPSAVAGEVLRTAIVSLGGSVESADFERVQAALHFIRGGAGGKHIQMGRGVTITADAEKIRIFRAQGGKS